ncbi:MAG: hypothetical protein WBV11_00045 [Salegentibacter sp.]
MGRLLFFFNSLYKLFELLRSGPAGWRPILISFSLFLTIPGAGLAQQDDLFNSKEIFRITLSGEIAALLRDTDGEPEYTAVYLSYSDEKGEIINIPLKLRQRGHFRRIKSNCSFPPLLLNFAKKNTASTIFDGQDKIKLVMPCRGDKYVLREYYAYKIYNLVSPRSFRVRLIEVKLDDAALKARERVAFYGFLLEEEEQMATRNNMTPIKPGLLRPEMMQREDFLNMAVFNYLIGNTDWSIQYRQNIKMIAEDTLSLPRPIPYDFDHAGIVRAPYAHPAKELKLSSTRQRRYRGFCMQDLKALESVLRKYDSLKKDIYAVYTSSPLLEEKYVQKTLKFLDEFYASLQDPEKLEKEFLYPCQKNGTGNVVIKGLKN